MAAGWIMNRITPEAEASLSVIVRMAGIPQAWVFAYEPSGKLPTPKLKGG